MLKESQVVMLPTEKASNIFLNIETNKLIFDKDFEDTIKEDWFQDQYLYILSDEEIKEGDWFLNIYSKIFDKAEKSGYIAGGIQPSCFKKIIATTNRSLDRQWRDHKNDLHIFNLPQPSQSFIDVFVKEYNRGNLIKKVMLEYEEKYQVRNKLIDWDNNDKFGEWQNCNLQTYNESFDIVNMDRRILLNLKVNPKDNTITIKKVKDNWNRDEIIKLMKKCLIIGAGNPMMSNEDCNKFIEENL